MKKVLLTGKDKPKKEKFAQLGNMEFRTFWLLAPNLFVLFFTVTGLFSYQFCHC